MARDIAKAYEPKHIEPRWAEYWVKEELFKADPNAPGPVFSIVIPPPNVTGMLHIGHMLNHTEIDILTRWYRMRGHNTLYLPGTDHAGISTQRVVVRQLTHKGIHYRDLGREEFVKRVWQWKEESGGTIQRQMKQIGESCDWSRERFTLSPELSRVVREVFVRLYEEGLIYREKRMVNWCPGCRTVLSDLEVIHEEKQGHLWYIRYPVMDSKDYLVVATTRPETMLGDTAVAVHPEDERYKHLVGKKVVLPLMNREIPIIGDEMVDREFGTGAVKITPAHDPNDFEAGKRHGLEQIDVMTDDAHMNENAGVYAGLERFAARKKIVEDLQAQGLIERITDHLNAIGHCERSRTIVEPRVSTQWFCKMKPLAEPAIAAVEHGDIQVIPDNRREEYFHWMRNIRDWCISRQLWWGHQIPAWYCRKCGEVIVSREDPTKCGKCGSGDLQQDQDVLDTWFSSMLWPFSTLGWPEKTADFQKYYPTNLLITAYDIIFFWVARMIMMGLHFTGKVPFYSVYLHTLVRTASGEKMSKSKGTGLDPVALNEQYGTDAMRFCLASMAAPGTDIVLSEDRMDGARAFANKIWNAARFLFVNLDKFEQGGGGSLETLAAPKTRAQAPYANRGQIPLVDRWLFARLAATVETVDDALTNYRFHEAAQAVYQFFWGDFCDWYIEWVKPELQHEDRDRASVAWKNLFAGFEAALRLLHPFMPFLTEELWHQLPQAVGAKSIALDSFPVADSRWKDGSAQRQMEFLQDLISSSRVVRAERKLPRNVRFRLSLGNLAEEYRELVRSNEETVCRLGMYSGVEYRPLVTDATTGVIRPAAFWDISISVPEQGDTQAEVSRLKKEMQGLEKAVASKERQLGSDTFRSKAPEKIIKQMEEALSAQRIELDKLKDRLKQLGCE